MKLPGVYMALVFFAAQFVAYFYRANIGLIVAIESAGFLKLVAWMIFLVRNSLLSIFPDSEYLKSFRLIIAHNIYSFIL